MYKCDRRSEIGAGLGLLGLFLVTACSASSGGSSKAADVPVGVTARTISVGLPAFDTTAVNAAGKAVTGKQGSAIPAATDISKAAMAVVDYINAHGGIAHRQIVPVIHGVKVNNTLTASGRDQEAQLACADWTQDHHVFAFINAFSVNTIPCAVSSRTVVLSDPNSAGQPWLSDSMFQQARQVWYGPDMMLAERHDRNLVEALWKQGFFAGGAKVGILIEDQAGSKTGVERGMLPALASHGIKPVVQIVYPDRLSSPWQNEILALQRAGADHLLLSSTAGQSFPALALMKAAENQHYRPKWGMGSDHWPVVLGYTGAPHAQMANITGMGWMPNLDTGDKAHISANSDVCTKIGLDSGQGDAVRLYCEDLFFLKFVLDEAPEVSVKGMNEALEAVAGRYTSTATVDGATTFSPARHDGPSSYRIFQYDSRCDAKGASCIKYTSPSQAMP